MTFLVHLVLAAISNTIVLLISMLVAYRLIGELDVGPVKTAVLKAAIVALVATAFSMVPLGIWFSIVVWLFAIMAVFRLRFQDAWILAVVNWLMGILTNQLLRWIASLFVDEG